MYRIIDDRIVERWAVNDLLTMLIELGALPIPSTTVSGRSS
jgi:hypothetical protein